MRSRRAKRQLFEFFRATPIGGNVAAARVISVAAAELSLAAAMTASAVLILLLPACSAVRPASQVAAPVPAQWRHTLPPTADPQAGASLAALSEWWRRWDDPLLLELIDAAQAASPTIATAAARIGEARASRVAADAALLPNLAGMLSASRSNGQGGSSGGAAALGAAEATSSTTNAAATSGSGTLTVPPITTYQAGLQASWEIDLFGRLRAGRDVADARLAGADARWHQARVSVAAETANSYFAERACERQLAVAESDARSRGETLRLTELSMRAGFTAPADAALVRAGAADSAARLKQQRAQCALLVQALVAMTGFESRDLEQKIVQAPVQPALPAIISIASVPAEALAQRPDVFAAERDVAAASAAVGQARAERFPRLSLSGSVGRLHLETSGLGQSLDTWSIGPLALSVPIFEGGVIAANERAAEGRYAEAAATYRANVRQAVREVEEALINLASTTDRAGDAQTSVSNYQASFDATRARYDAGLASLFDLEQARRTLFAAQTAQVALRRERAEAAVALYRAMGGGWSRTGNDPDSVRRLASSADAAQNPKIP